MNNSNELKLKVIETVISLPDDELFKVADFINGLKSIESVNGDEARNGEIRATRDPLLDLIGIVDDGSLPSTSAQIDELLYGDNPL